MEITQLLTWSAVNWPITSASSQYTVYQIYPGAVTAQQNTATNSASLTYDDSVAQAYQIRPSSGLLSALTVGPEVMVYTVGFVPCRGWLRQKVRMALADRADSSATQLNWPDDEINTYITEAIGELNVTFPLENSTTMTLLPPTIDGFGNQAGVRNYTLPADFYGNISTVEYVTVDGRLHLYLKEKPWKGGDSTATSYLGYPKLGILLSPITGRFYPGHYQIYNGQLQIDWDPAGDGDLLNVNYTSRRALPINDGDILTMTLEDCELAALYTQMKCWLRVEVQDARLSRWRTKEDGSRRDDLPTIKHWTQIKQLYDQRVNDRRELRPRTRRLVRR